MVDADCPWLAPNGPATRRRAENAIRELEAGNIEDGLTWLRGFVEAYRDTRTAELLTAVERSNFGEAARILRSYL